MNRQLEFDADQPREPQLPLNREERRKMRRRPDMDLQPQNQASERLRDTRNRASFVRRLGPR